MSGSDLDVTVSGSDLGVTVSGAGLGDIAIRVTSDDPRVVPSWRVVGDAPAVLEVACDRAADVEIRLEQPLGDAAGFWHPTCGSQRTLAPDWTGVATSSLVRGAPAGCLYDNSGRCRMAFAAAELTRQTQFQFGVSEEDKSFVVTIRARADADQPCRVALLGTSELSVAQSLRALRAWLREGLGESAPTTPGAARVPVFSTWYAFQQQVTAEAVEREAAAAATLGCEVLIVDDGWQQQGHGRGYAGCGSWRPDPNKFPDLAAHVRRVRQIGMRHLLWVAPLLIGEKSELYAEWAPYATARAAAPGAYVLDPRYPRVRRHVIELCAGLVREYELDGLKLDFVDEVMAYTAATSALAGAGSAPAAGPAPAAGSASGAVPAPRVGAVSEPILTSERDVDDIGEAMRLLLADLREALTAACDGREPLIELRQPYVGPAMTGWHGNMLRAGDCPGDATVNRVSTIDVGLLALGGAVHSDMLMWDPAADAPAAVRQLLGVLHSVPQISMRLTTLSATHTAALSFWLRKWRELRDVLLDGDVEPGRPDELYPVVTASARGECVVSVFADRVSTVDLARYDAITVVNATALGRVVLDVTGRDGEHDITVHDSAGQIVERARKTVAAGLQALPIPPSGLAVLHRTTDH